MSNYYRYKKNRYFFQKYRYIDIFSGIFTSGPSEHGPFVVHISYFYSTEPSSNPVLFKYRPTSACTTRYARYYGAWDGRSIKSKTNDDKTATRRVIKLKSSRLFGRVFIFNSLTSDGFAIDAVFVEWYTKSQVCMYTRRPSCNPTRSVFINEKCIRRVSL